LAQPVAIDRGLFPKETVQKQKFYCVSKDLSHMSTQKHEKRESITDVTSDNGLSINKDQFSPMTTKSGVTLNFFEIASRNSLRCI
jgi:hypothetical protein